MTTHTPSKGFSTPQLRVNPYWLLALAAFLFVRPYAGITHDARMYVGYAAALLDPAGIGTDIMFAHDGQSGYSLFPRLFALAIKTLGLHNAAFLVTYTSLIAWFTAVSLLVSRMTAFRLSSREVLVYLAAISALPSLYGGLSLFHYAESFPTPRALSEALIILSLAIGDRQKYVSIAVSLMALLVHPIIAAPGIALLFWILLPNDRSRFVALGAGGLVLAGILLGSCFLESDSRPLSRFDDAWRQILRSKITLVFLRTWTYEDFARIIVQASMLVVGIGLPNEYVRRLVVGCLLATAASLVLSYIGGDVLGNVVITQGQAWRVLWLTALLANIVWIMGYAHSIELGEEVPNVRNVRASILMFPAALFALEFNTNLAIVISVLGLGLWLTRYDRRLPSLPRYGDSMIRAFCLVTVAVVVGAKCYVVYTILLAAPTSSVWHQWSTHLSTGLVQCGMIVAALVLLRKRRRIAEQEGWYSRRRAFLTAGFAVTLCLVTWDSRSQYQVTLEQALAHRLREPKSVDAFASGSVFWLDSDLEAWALLGRAAWGSSLQGVASVFDRELSVKWHRRRELLRKQGLAPAKPEDRYSQVSPKAIIGEDDRVAICASEEPPELIAVPENHWRGRVPIKTIKLDNPKLYYPRQWNGSWEVIENIALVAC